MTELELLKKIWALEDRVRALENAQGQGAAQQAQGYKYQQQVDSQGLTSPGGWNLAQDARRNFFNNLPIWPI